MNSAGQTFSAVQYLKIPLIELAAFLSFSTVEVLLDMALELDVQCIVAGGGVVLSAKPSLTFGL